MWQPVFLMGKTRKMDLGSPHPLPPLRERGGFKIRAKDNLCPKPNSTVACDGIVSAYFFGKHIPVGTIGSKVYRGWIAWSRVSIGKRSQDKLQVATGDPVKGEEHPR